MHPTRWYPTLGDVPNGDISYLRITTAVPQAGTTVAGLVGYFLNGPLNLGGEWWPESVPAWGTEFVFSFDLTKTYRDDPYMVIEDALLPYLAAGSPPRKTARTGPVGTQKWAGLAGPFTVAWA